MNNLQLEQLLNQKLNAAAISDYAPNGLQIEGKSEIKKIITGVTASQALIDYAVSCQADALLVHHGYFWKNENPCIRGMKGKRIKTLLSNNINLYGYHLPLDIHPELGNNAQLAKLLGIENLQPLEQHPNSIPMWGTLQEPVTAEQFAVRIEQIMNRTPLFCDAEKFNKNAPHFIKVGKKRFSVHWRGKRNKKFNLLTPFIYGREIFLSPYLLWKKTEMVFRDFRDKKYLKN